MEAAARKQFQETRAAILSGSKTGLPAADAKALLGVSLDAYVTLTRKDYAGGYATAALAGLGVTGGRRGRRVLQQVAANPNSPYRDIARLTLYGDADQSNK